MAETGHAANRVFIDQDGNFNLNGAAFKNDADTDISAQLETVVGSSAAGMKLVFGSSANSSNGVNQPPHGLTTVLHAWANVLSTAGISSTNGGIAQLGLKFGGSTFEVVAFKHTSTTDPSLVVATSTAFSIAWAAIGTP